MPLRALWTALLLVTLPPVYARLGGMDTSAAGTLLLLDGPGRALLVNRTLSPLGITACGATLESLEQGAWVAAPAPAGCGAEVRILMPGDSGTLQVHCPTRPGTYRLALPVTLQREALDPLMVVERSRAFRIGSVGDDPGPCRPAQDR